MRLTTARPMTCGGTRPTGRRTPWAAAACLALVGALLSADNVEAQHTQVETALLSLDSLLSIPISSASKYDQSAREAAASVSVITSDEIEAYGYRTLGQALSHVRGFYANDDRNYFYLGARGISRPSDYNNKVLLLLDGHAMNENFYDAAFLDTTFGLDLAAMERIEIVRGPSAAVYGSNAMLAIVNVVTKHSETASGNRLNFETGAFGLKRGALSLLHEFDNGLAVSFSGNLAESEGEDFYFGEFDDPETNGGIASGLDQDRHVGLHATATWRDLSLAVYGASRRKGIPTGPWEVNFNDPRAETLDARRFAELQFDHDMSSSANLFVRGYYDWYAYDGSYPYEEPGGIWADSTDGRWVGSEVRLRWDPIPANRVLVGAEVRRNMRSDYRSGDAEEWYLRDDFPFTVLSAYIQDELQLGEKVSITLGLRGDDYSDQGGRVSPRGALLFFPREGSTAKLLYGQAFRTPNRWEFNYVDGDVHKRNPDLKPETIETFELVLEQRLSRILFGAVSLYQFRYEDLIEETTDPVDEMQTYTNVGQVDARGVEVELRARSEGGVGGYASFVHQLTEDVDLDERLTNSPGDQLRAGAFAPLGEHFVVGADLIHDSERITVQETMTDSYWLANVTLTGKRLLDRIDVQLSAQNVFDSDYRTPGGFEHLQAGIPQRGRYVSLFVGFGF